LALDLGNLVLRVGQPAARFRGQPLPETVAVLPVGERRAVEGEADERYPAESVRRLYDDGAVVLPVALGRGEPAGGAVGPRGDVGGEAAAGAVGVAKSDVLGQFPPNGDPLQRAGGDGFFPAGGQRGGQKFLE